MKDLTKKEKNNLLKLYNEDFANFFNVSYDDKYKFNINKNIYFLNFDTLAPSMFYKYEVQEGDHWSIISSKVYGTVELWWIICRVNQIWNPTEPLIPSTILKILNKDVVSEIIAEIN